MYLENAKKSRFKILYVILPLLLFLASIDAIGDNNSEELKSMIEKNGELLMFAINMFSFVILLGLFFLFVKIGHKQSILSLTTSREKFDFKRLFFSILVWGGILVSVNILSVVIFKEEYIWNYTSPDFWILVLISFLLVPFQISFEEYFFRGYLMQGVYNYTNKKWIALLISGIFFGMAHIANPEIESYGSWFIIVYIFMGLFLGAVVVLDDGMELTMGYHFINNFIISIMITSEDTVFNTPSLWKEVGDNSMSAIEILFLFLPEIIVFCIFYKKYKWNLKSIFE